MSEKKHTILTARQNGGALGLSCWDHRLFDRPPHGTLGASICRALLAGVTVGPDRGGKLILGRLVGVGQVASGEGDDGAAAAQAIVHSPAKIAWRAGKRRQCASRSGVTPSMAAGGGCCPGPCGNVRDKFSIPDAATFCYN